MRGKEVIFAKGWNGWPTPKDLFETLNRIFCFDTDLAADEDNALLPRFFSEEDNALEQNWENLCGFCNPPYALGKEFVEKCIRENDFARLVVLLLPARVDTKWFHSLPNDTPIFFFKGRLKFGRLEKNSPAPFPSMLIFFGKNRYLAKSIAGKHFLNGRWATFSS